MTRSPNPVRPHPVRPLPLILATLALFSTLSSQEKTPTPAPPAADTAAPSGAHDAMARFVAGLPIAMRTDLSDWQETASWKKYAEHFDSAWSRLESTQVAAINRWATDELKDCNAGNRAVFYPFSGPDFLYGYTFFPNGAQYILMGLEPVGAIPTYTNIRRVGLDNFLSSFQYSVNSFFNLNFFKTVEMRQKLTPAELGGTLPIILLFIARTGNVVMDIKLIELDPEQGTITETPCTRPDSLDPRAIPGAKVLFRKPGRETIQEVYYFSLDIDDHSLKNKPGFLTFIKGHGPVNGFTKAASYLMHRSSFSTIRGLVLDRSAVFLQDDSGIPLTFFDPGVWNLRFFGNYTKPIRLFAVRFQPDLRAVYEKKSDIKPLPFDISYRVAPAMTNLMLAVKKDTAPGVQAPR